MRGCERERRGGGREGEKGEMEKDIKKGEGGEELKRGKHTKVN